MINKQLPNVRVVKCPRCAKLRLEPEHVPLYICGGCKTTLQGAMELVSWQTLLHNISSFFSLSAHGSFGSGAVQNCYRKIEEILMLLKPIADLILDISILSDDQHSKGLEQLIRTIEECTYLFVNCHPLASKIILSCIENIKNMVCESTSIISEAMKEQASSRGFHMLAKFVESLGLKSNQDILIEAIALEKLKENAKKAGNDAKMDHLEQLITLLTRMHDHLFILEQSKSGIPNSIAAYSICPLSLEIMRDPVIVSSGKTYERAYIKKWLDLGLTVCPMTRQTLVHQNLIPNYTSKALITNWCEVNKVKLPDPMKSVNQQNLDNIRDKVDLNAKVKKLIEDLQRKSNESLREATAQLQLFVKQNVDNRNLITYFGGIRLVVNLLSSTDPMIQENAVTALLYLAINNDNKVAIADEDAIEPLIYVLQVGTPKARENSAATLFCLSMIDKNKLEIGRSGAIVPLVKLLGEGTPPGKNNAVIALFNVSISHENRLRIVQAGGVRFLVKLVSDPVAGMAEKAIAILANLAKITEGRTAIGQAGGIPVLVNTLELGSTRAKGCAVSALLYLCTFSSRLCAIVIKEAVVPPLVVFSLSKTGTSRAEEKAKALLSYIRRQQCYRSEGCSVASDINEWY